MQALNAKRFLVLLLLWLPSVQGRFEAGTLSSAADEDLRWQYVGKFGYGIGKGTYQARVRARDPETSLRFKLDLYLDEDWPLAAALPQCSPEQVNLARTSRDLVAARGQWSSWADGEVEQHQRAHIWYFALSGCAAVGRNATSGLDYEIRYLNPDSSELSVELRYMPCATLLAVLCLTAFLVQFAQRCRRFHSSLGTVPPVLRALASAALLQWAAEVLHLLHLRWYEQQGVGESFLEAASGMLFMMSQVASCTLLIAIAKGYTLLNTGDMGLNCLRRVAVPVALVHAGLVGHGSWQGDHSDKHHENEGAVGWMIVLVRLLLFAWFVMCARELHQQCRSFRLQGFLDRFVLAGSAYFLAFPLLYCIVQAFAPYLQHPLLHIGTASMQTCASVWLAELFLSRGDYFEVSTLSSPLLPSSFGGAGVSLKKGQ